jgi:pSer/pThr/pTyr-binding forkhead associated (FHA) protein/tetratricopeptide (TPR) repeat protein
MKLKLYLHSKVVFETELKTSEIYTFGRSADCTVCLEALAGISRNHCKISEIDGVWSLQASSKFGEVLLNGSLVSSNTIEIDQIYRLGEYEIRIENLAPTASEPNHFPAINESRSLAIVNDARLPQVKPDRAEAAQKPEQEDFDGNNEATSISQAMLAIPYVRVVYGPNSEQVIKLDGKKWTAGRESGCDIPIENSKVSRRQFELTASPQGYFLRDLGSSNGTLLNGQRLEPDELKPIQSGDIIGVLSVSIYFEIRDPEFENKMSVVPAEMLYNSPAIAPAQYEVVSFPTLRGTGGAVRFPSTVGPMGQFDPRSNKKVRIYIVIGVLLAALGIGAFLDDSGQKKPAYKDEFSRLNPRKKEEIKQAYLLAKNLHAQRKYSLALSQLKKIHELIPSGFEDSLMMSEQCLASEEADSRKKQIDEERRRQEEIVQQIDANVRECNAKAEVIVDIREIQGCLSRALALDPTNSKVLDMITKVRKRAEDLAADESRKSSYRKGVLQGKALYNKAVMLEGREEFFEAITAYEKHLGSGLPDPDSLKTQSRNAISKIKKSVGENVGQSLSAAKVAYQNKSFKEAMIHIGKALKIDTQNQETLELLRDVRRDKDIKLQEIYSEAVILEGLSKVSEAKEKWKQVLELDVPGETYYQRSQNKLRQFGQIGDGK